MILRSYPALHAQEPSSLPFNLFGDETHLALRVLKRLVNPQQRADFSSQRVVLPAQMPQSAVIAASREDLVHQFCWGDRATLPRLKFLLRLLTVLRKLLSPTLDNATMQDLYEGFLFFQRQFIDGFQYVSKRHHTRHVGRDSCFELWIFCPPSIVQLEGSTGSVVCSMTITCLPWVDLSGGRHHCSVGHKPAGRHA